MLLDFCLSLWVAQISGLVVLETFFTIIACALEKIKDKCKPDIYFNDGRSMKAYNFYESCIQQ